MDSDKFTFVQDYNGPKIRTEKRMALSRTRKYSWPLHAVRSRQLMRTVRRHYSTRTILVDRFTFNE